MQIALLIAAPVLTGLLLVGHQDPQQPPGKPTQREGAQPQEAQPQQRQDQQPSDQQPSDSGPGGKLVPGKLDPELLQKLKWISGTWVCRAGKVTIEEHWRPLQGTLILGSSHTFDSKQTHFFEQLYIGCRGGHISYVAIPAGSKSTSFELAEVADGLMVFENPKHDHPQRIRYERTEGGMKATISQLDGSRATVFPFKRKPE